MYKKLRYGLIALLAFVGLTASAQVTFDFDADNSFQMLGLDGESGDKSDLGDIGTTVSWSQRDYKVYISPADPPAEEGQTVTPNRIWSSSPKLRVYSGTITIQGQDIVNIEFIGDDNPNITPSVGQRKGNVWTGSTNRVVFTVNGNTKISKIIINGDAVPPSETEEDLNHGTEDDPLSVAEAIYAAGVVGNTNSTNDFYVYGTISSIVTDSKNNNTPFTYSYKGTATYYITDGKGNEFEIYQGKYFSGVTWTTGMADIEVGDKVVVCGKIINYKGTTPEFASGKSNLVLLNGSGYVEPVIVEPTIQNITVEDFLAEPVSNDTWYRLTGMVTNLKANDNYGNFDLVDKTGSVYVYGVLSEKGGEKKKFQELVGKYGIENGGYITIIGNRGYYAKNDQIQVANAYFEDYEAGADPETYEVNVTEALDVIDALADNQTAFDNYQVTGYVVDAPNYENGYEGKFTGTVDLYLADTKDGEAKLFVYHGLGLGNEKFTGEDDLDLFVEGDQVTFFGKLQKYIDKDNNTILELKDCYLVKASASLEMPASGLATFCSAYPIEIEDQNVYIVTQVGEDKALVQKVDAGIIESGTGLLVEGSGTVSFAYAYGEKGNALSGNMLVGTMVETDLAKGEAYILKDGAFHLSNAGTFPARKAYLPVDAASGAKLFIDFSGMTTAISEVKTQNESSEIYTIGGVRVKNAQQKGVYIINGKKVVK